MPLAVLRDGQQFEVLDVHAVAVFAG